MAIRRIQHKGLRDLFVRGTSAKVGVALQSRAIEILDHLDAATGPEDCKGVRDFHGLSGQRDGQYAMSVSGNWRITFEFDDNGEITVLDLEDYH